MGGGSIIDETLGRLERVDLRYIWESEATHFTPWLARLDNLAILAETLGIELELEQPERSVGLFRADILCKEPESESWVLIENQLERTDHKHLGQLLTYAAGLDAVTVIWIAARFTDEHRATLDWLNEITDERFRFFGLQVELWRIGTSPPAPRFNIVCEPNDWSRLVGRAQRQIRDGSVPERAEQQLRYWQALNDFFDNHEHRIRKERPRGRNWARYGLRQPGIRLVAALFKNRIRASLRVEGENGKTNFTLLGTERDEIERAVGETLAWEDLPTGGRIGLYKDNADPTNEEDWPNQHRWLADALIRLDRVFSSRVAAWSQG